MSFTNKYCDAYGVICPGEESAVSPKSRGTKVGAHYVLTVPPGGEAVIRTRLYDVNEKPRASFGHLTFDNIFTLRRREADSFYDQVSNVI